MKLIITDRDHIVAPDGISFEVNGKASQEISLKQLNKEEIGVLKRNPKDKTILAKIGRIKGGDK